MNEYHVMVGMSLLYCCFHSRMTVTMVLPLKLNDTSRFTTEFKGLFLHFSYLKSRLLPKIWKNIHFQSTIDEYKIMFLHNFPIHFHPPQPATSEVRFFLQYLPYNILCENIVLCLYFLFPNESISGKFHIHWFE